jgi:hypothetical protein
MDGGWTREVHAHRTAVKTEEARLRRQLQRKGLYLDNGSSNAGLSRPPTPSRSSSAPPCTAQALRTRSRQVSGGPSDGQTTAGLLPLLAVAAAIGTRILWERDGRRLDGRLGMLRRLGDGARGVAATAREQLRRVPWLRDAMPALRRPRGGGGAAWGRVPGDEGRRLRRPRELTPSELAGRAAARRAAEVRSCTSSALMESFD